jgi:hypothetical protein
VAFIGILVTLVLGVYNAVQNYRSSRRTTFINTVTSERVKWIEKLRQSISTFYGLLEAGSLVKAVGDFTGAAILADTLYLRDCGNSCL